MLHLVEISDMTRLAAKCKIQEMNERWSWHWGDWIRARANFLGMNLRQLAEASSTTPRSMSRWLKSVTPPHMQSKSSAQLAASLKVDRLHLGEVQVYHRPDEPGILTRPKNPDFYTEEWQHELAYIADNQLYLRRLVKGLADELTREQLLVVALHAMRLHDDRQKRLAKPGRPRKTRSKNDDADDEDGLETPQKNPRF